MKGGEGREKGILKVGTEEIGKKRELDGGVFLDSWTVGCSREEILKTGKFY